MKRLLKPKYINGNVIFTLGKADEATKSKEE
jgi:hypothetical protein